MPVIEHQDIWAGNTAARNASGKGRFQLAGTFIDRRLKGIGRPDPRLAGEKTLQVVDRTMAFVYPLRRKSGLLKLTVHVAGKDKGPMYQALCITTKYSKALVVFRGALILQAVTVEAPGLPGIEHKGRGIGDLAEVDPRTPQGRVSRPESIMAPEIGKAGVDSHAGTGRNQ